MPGSLPSAYVRLEALAAHTEKMLGCRVRTHTLSIAGRSNMQYHHRQCPGPAEATLMGTIVRPFCCLPCSVRSDRQCPLRRAVSPPAKAGAGVFHTFHASLLPLTYKGHGPENPNLREEQRVPCCGAPLQPADERPTFDYSSDAARNLNRYWCSSTYHDAAGWLARAPTASKVSKRP